ncbi:MAG TPA: hypothetical protein VM009_07350 [Terriglobales bacterium]|nr:hypothetical protein [Terriglobales bacterium]
MRRRFLLSCMLMVGLASWSVAQAPPSAIEELKTKAESMKDYERGKIYSEIARELTEQANRQFADGQLEPALETVKQVIEFSEKASASAKLRNKKTKDTEINLRRTARRLEEVERSLAVEDRPPVRAAVEKVDAIRKDLLEFFLKRG